MSASEKIPFLREQAETRLREIAGLIGPACPAGYGFLLTFFTFGEEGDMSYISNADREGAIKLLRELADKLESEPKRS